ncbi:MAG: hypothetical protein FWH17_04475 [Oscillospiraceae bacterium]|nr:hypothetical protein [Oscillospiraceae bacterium]
MTTQIAKWGNGQGIKIEASLLHRIGLSVGDTVDVVKLNESIVIKPQNRRDLDWYLQDYERPDGDVGWVDEHDPRGREIW